MFVMTLLPGGALVNFLELNLIIFVDFHISVMRFCLE